MGRIDEWNPVYPKRVASPAPAPIPDHGATQPSHGQARPATALVDDIYGKLLSIQADPPLKVHFYLGEGLRWIRVGFNESGPLTPRAVRDVGEIIQTCIEDPAGLYFHALRPHDMLFFLEGGEEDATGMPPGCFGTPLDDVLRAWGLVRR